MEGILRKMCQKIFENGNASDNYPDTLDDLILAYVDRFGQNFPIMAMRGTPDSEIIDLINTALNTGVPYELPPDDLNIVY